MALIDTRYFDTVVAIGSETPNDGTKRESDLLRWIGTGFMVGRPFKAGGVEGFHVFLVTNKHVLRGMDSFVARFNPKEGAPILNHRFVLADDEKQLWTGHPKDDIDIAAIDVNTAMLREHGRIFDYFNLNEALMNIDQMIKLGLSEGDFVYILGYPMGLADPEWHYPVVRSGTIARIRDMLDGRKSSFLLDSLIFPGNSGGPVILKPEPAGVGAQPPIGTAYVIGIVSSHLVYGDNKQHSGLATVFPSECVSETVEAHFKRMRLDSDYTLRLS